MRNKMFMQYQNEAGFRHGEPDILGVLMVNLGTPDSPDVTDVRRYLAEFLSDPRVVELPRHLWLLLLHGVILRVRPRHSAHAYQQIWTPEGSPLLCMAQRQAQALQVALEGAAIGPVRVVLAMRYGTPSVAEGLQELRAAQARRLLVLPMYPQYSATTTASVLDAVTEELRTWRWVPELRCINQYHDAPAYIDALAASVLRHWAEHGEPERLLFSFHGIPRDYFLKGDPYYCQCQKTARLVVERLGLPAERWQISFQSRVGNQEWLQPYTDHQLQDWGQAGITGVQVICPGFSADCLETLEEIAMENRDLFLGAGGQAYGYIPALNDRPDHIQALVQVVRRHIQGWPEGDAALRQTPQADYPARLERARQLGAED